MKKERHQLTLKTLKTLSIHSSRDRILLRVVFKYTIIKLICLVKIQLCLDVEDDFTYKIVLFQCFRRLIFFFFIKSFCSLHTSKSKVDIKNICS